jgi:hypothetical protein
MDGIGKHLFDLAHVLLQVNDVAFDVFDSLHSDLSAHGPRAEGRVGWTIFSMEGGMAGMPIGVQTSQAFEL